MNDLRTSEKGSAAMIRKALLSLAFLGMLGTPLLADTIQLTGTVRDFKRGDWTGGHPDFETCNNVPGHGVFGQTIGLVSYQLGSDNKPVYNPTRPSNDSMYSQTSFSQWYNDTPGVNSSMPLAITLSNGQTAPGGVYTYSNSAFFPIDGLLLGNQGQLDASEMSTTSHSPLNCTPSSPTSPARTSRSPAMTTCSSSSTAPR